MYEKKIAPKPEFASDIFSEGFAGILVPSFVPGASVTDLKLVLWRWGTDDCVLEVIDDERRMREMNERWENKWTRRMSFSPAATPKQPHRLQLGDSRRVLLRSAAVPG